MVFKTLVIGVIVFVPRNLQLPYVFLVTLVFLVFSSSVQPYKAMRDNSFEYHYSQIIESCLSDSNVFLKVCV